MRFFQPLPILTIVTVVAVSGCGGGGSAAGSAVTQATAPTASSAGSSPTTASSAAPEPSVATVVAPGGDAAPVEPALKELWKGTGSPAGPKDCTGSPAVDPDGQVWTALCWADSFWVFDKKGNFLEPWGTKGSGPGQFDFAMPSADDAIGGIAFAPDGTFYTYDAGNLRIQHFDAKRTLIGTWGSFGNGDGQFAKPTDIAVGPASDLYVADGARGDVQVFGPDGTFKRSIGEGIGQPDHFAWFGVDGKGNVYAAQQNHVIVKYGADGQPLLRIDCTAIDGDTTDTAIDPEGNIFVSFTSDEEPFVRGLAEFDPEGTLKHSWPGIGDYITIVDDGTAILATSNHQAYVKKFALPKD
jgi:hypothetical protein